MSVRPTSNRDYKVKNRETGEWEVVKATPTPKETPKVYSYKAKYKRANFEESAEKFAKRFHKNKVHE